MSDLIQTFVADQVDQHEQIASSLGGDQFMILIFYFVILAGYALLVLGLLELSVVYLARLKSGGKMDMQKSAIKGWLKMKQRYARIFDPKHRADLESKVMRAAFLLIVTAGILSLGMGDPHLAIFVPGIFCSYFAWRIYWSGRYAAHVRIVVMVLTFLAVLPRQGFLAALFITALFFVFCNGRLDDRGETSEK